MRKNSMANMLFWVYSLITILVMLCLTSGCANGIEHSNETEYKEFVDYQGTRVKIPKKPRRILTLSLGFDVMTMGVVPPERFVAYAIKGIANYAYGPIFDLSDEKLIKGY